MTSKKADPGPDRWLGLGCGPKLLMIPLVAFKLVFLAIGRGFTSIR